MATKSYYSNVIDNLKSYHGAEEYALRKSGATSAEIRQERASNNEQLKYLASLKKSNPEIFYSPNSLSYSRSTLSGNTGAFVPASQLMSDLRDLQDTYKLSRLSGSESASSYRGFTDNALMHGLYYAQNPDKLNETGTRWGGILDADNPSGTETKYNLAETKDPTGYNIAQYIQSLQKNGTTNIPESSLKNIKPVKGQANLYQTTKGFGSGHNDTNSITTYYTKNADGTYNYVTTDFLRNNVKNTSGGFGGLGGLLAIAGIAAGGWGLASMLGEGALGAGALTAAEGATGLASLGSSVLPAAEAFGAAYGPGLVSSQVAGMASGLGAAGAAGSGAMGLESFGDWYGNDGSGFDWGNISGGSSGLNYVGQLAEAGLPIDTVTGLISGTGAIPANFWDSIPDLTDAKKLKNAFDLAKSILGSAPVKDILDLAGKFIGTNQVDKSVQGIINDYMDQIRDASPFSKAQQKELGGIALDKFNTDYLAPQFDNLMTEYITRGGQADAFGGILGQLYTDPFSNQGFSALSDLAANNTMRALGAKGRLGGNLESDLMGAYVKAAGDYAQPINQSWQNAIHSQTVPINMVNALNQANATNWQGGAQAANAGSTTQQVLGNFINQSAFPASIGSNNVLNNVRGIYGQSGANQANNTIDPITGKVIGSAVNYGLDKLGNFITGLV